MKILLLCEGDAETYASWSGVSRSVLRHLRAMGHTVVPRDVDLYGTARLATAIRTAAWPRRRWWVRYHLDRPAFQARSREAARRIRSGDGDFDVILQVGATFKVPRDLKVPLVLYCDSNIEMSRAAAGSGYSDASSLKPRELEDIRRREAEVYNAADLICTMSHRLSHSFMEDFGIAPERLLTVHCGANLDSYEASSRPVVANKAPTVLFVGRDFGRKGGDLLIDAFASVRKRVPDAVLEVVGPEKVRETAPWLKTLGYLSRDKVEGRRAIDEAYRRANVFCLPTRFEPFGTAFVEAMTYQLPCVGPDVGAVPEIILDGETGIIVPPENPAALAEALTQLLLDPARARQMGEKGKDRALSQFSWPAVVSRMSNAMEALVRIRQEV